MATIIPTPRVPWRAGRYEPGYDPATASMPPMSEVLAGPYTLVGDVSEFQPWIADASYLAWSKAIIIRAAYGDAHDDGAWYGGARRADLHAGGVKFLGIYQYIVASQDPVNQARVLAQLVGTLQPGELIIGDLEEGTGDQKPRWLAWAAEIERLLGQSPWDYSGLDFSVSADIAPVDWVAAYQATEPTVPHKLWQFTDSFNIPGVGICDCSVYHGTVDQLAALAYQKPSVYAAQPTSLSGSARFTNATLVWSPGARTEEYEVYLAHPDGTTIEKVSLPASATSHEFHRINPFTQYKLGVLAKPEAPGVQAQYVDVHTK